MGDPRRLRKKYKKPKKLWEKSRIQRDKALKEKYGLKNTRELWIMEAELRKVRRVARRLLPLPPEERREEQEKIVNKLLKWGILQTKDIQLEELLNLKVEDFLERRLQTQVYRLGLAASPRQARQLITHGFIAVNGVITTSPGYVVKVDDQITLARAWRGNNAEKGEESQD